MYDGVDIVFVGDFRISTCELLVNRFHLLEVSYDVILLRAVHLVESSFEVRLLMERDLLDTEFYCFPHFVDILVVGYLHVYRVRDDLSQRCLRLGVVLLPHLGGFGPLLLPFCPHVCPLRECIVCFACLFYWLGLDILIAFSRIVDGQEMGIESNALDVGLELSFKYGPVDAINVEHRDSREGLESGECVHCQG